MSKHQRWGYTSMCRYTIHVGGREPFKEAIPIICLQLWHASWLVGSSGWW